MHDPRIDKLAKVLVHYSLDLQPGERFALTGNTLAADLIEAVYREAALAGSLVYPDIILPGLEDLLMRHGNEAQLADVCPVQKLMADTFDASLYIGADDNTRSLAGVNPERISARRKAYAPLSRITFKRAAAGELKWCYTIYPTQAFAQEADMGLYDYADFVFGAGLLNEPDPVALWKAEGERQQRLIAWLAGHDQVVLKGDSIDLKLSIAGRSFVEASGKNNFPDGEIYVSPVEPSVEGWVRFSYPGIYAGQEVEDIELWFEEGRVVKESAAKGAALLTELLDTDEGSRILGELGFGTNYGIQRFTKNMLFDEKMGGTIHLAVGAGFPESGSKNESGLHWDMLCDMAEGKVTVDGELFYLNGRFAIE